MAKLLGRSYGPSKRLGALPFNTKMESWSLSVSLVHVGTNGPIFSQLMKKE